MNVTGKSSSVMLKEGPTPRESRWEIRFGRKTHLAPRRERLRNFWRGVFSAKTTFSGFRRPVASSGRGEAQRPG